MESESTATETNVTSLEPASSTIGPKVVETITKAFVDREGKQHGHGEGPGTVVGNVPANESIVEREIREQREREEALASERAAAAFLLRNEIPRNQILRDFNDTRNAEKNEISIEENSEIKRHSLPSTPDAYILLQLDQMTSELKFVEDTNNNACKNMVKASDGISHNFLKEKVNSVENICNYSSSQSTDRDTWETESSQSHDKYERMGSPVSFQNQNGGLNSPQELHSSRSNLVKPLSEPEDDSSRYIRWQKETPIEREIRLIREREEELRREKGFPQLLNNNVYSTRKSEVQKFNKRKNLTLNDCRSVQHRVATSRIQQEINEATEREKELHAAGLIRTISEDTVDSKVTRFTDLAGFAIEETERKLRRAISTSSITKESENQTVETNINNGQQTPISRSLFEKNTSSFSNFSKTSSPNTSVSPKNFSPNVGTKGIMQRFLASHGKLNPTVSNIQERRFKSVQQRYEFSNSPVLPPKLNLKQKIEPSESQVPGDSPGKNLRHGYLSTGEKIQAELEEMHKREEELRIQRAKLFAQSPADLSTDGNFEENNWRGESMAPTLGKSQSISETENSKYSNGELFRKMV